MATRKLNMLEKLANASGVIYRYHMTHFPRRWTMVKQCLAKELAPPRRSDWPAVKADWRAMAMFIESKAYNQWTVRVRDPLP